MPLKKETEPNRAVNQIWINDMKVLPKQRCVIEFLHTEKNCTHSHLSMFAERLLRPNYIWARLGYAFQQWQLRW